MRASARDLGWARDPGLNFPQYCLDVKEQARAVYWELDAWSRSDRLSRGEKRRARRAGHALLKFLADINPAPLGHGLPKREPDLGSLDLALGAAESIAVNAWGTAGTARFRRRAARLEAAADRLISRLEEISGPIGRAPASAVREARRTRGSSEGGIDLEGVDWKGGTDSESSDRGEPGSARTARAREGAEDDGWDRPDIHDMDEQARDAP